MDLFLGGCRGLLNALSKVGFSVQELIGQHILTIAQLVKRWEFVEFVLFKENRGVCKWPANPLWNGSQSVVWFTHLQSLGWHEFAKDSFFSQ